MEKGGERGMIKIQDFDQAEFTIDVEGTFTPTELFAAQTTRTLI